MFSANFSVVVIFLGCEQLSEGDTTSWQITWPIGLLMITSFLLMDALARSRHV